MDKGNQSEVGEESATENSKAEVDNLVDDVLGLGDQSPDVKEEEEEKEEEVSQEEEVKEEAEEEDGDSGTEEEKQEDEDVIPASKLKKLEESMQKRIDSLVAENKSLKTETESKEPNQSERLEKLSVRELNELRENVDDTIMDLKVDEKVNGNDNSAKITEFRDLKRNIAETVKSTPQKFQKRQIDNLNAMTEELKELDPNVVNRKGDLWNAANSIYSRMPSLANSETGMAEAMAIAAQYIIERKQLSTGRDKVKGLKQKVTKLKQKTALDGSNVNASESKETFKRLRANAIKGSHDDKLSFVKTLVPDDFLQT